jgi:hypothetical protein
MNAKFRVIEYPDIDLSNTELLLKEQGVLVVELGWFRAHTLMALINQEKKHDSYLLSRQSYARRVLSLMFDLLCLMPFVLISSNLVVLHCIYVNHCSYAEWEKLSNGKFRFSLL